MDDPSFGQLARQVRERLEALKFFGCSVPLRRGALAPRDLPVPQPQSAASAGPGAVDERVRREALLAPLRAEVAACTRCTLCQKRTQTVFGVGDPTARLLFVGEAPGADEDRQGEPFVGAAGQLLNDIIRAMTLERAQVYIANVIKCRPPQNRTPEPLEISACREYLERQIEIVAPAAMIALGAVSARTLLGTESSISRLRGKFHDYRGIPLVVTYHPAYLLRQPADKRLVWEDVQLVMARLGLRRP